MKRLGISILAALMVVSVAIPAWALESQFGGYWRTRFYTNQNFKGEDSTEAWDFNRVDTRTRLYYTAIFHENLKFVNKFEFNTTWGDTNGGDMGADGTGHIRVKNSYADFNTGPVNWKVGIQGGTLARGFIFSDDFSGINVAYVGDTFKVPFMWIKAFEGGEGMDADDNDVDYYAIAPSFSLGMVNLNPYFMYAYSKDVSAWNPNFHIPVNNNADPAGLRTNDLNIEDIKVWYLGFDADFDFDMGNAWMTAIYQGGTVDMANGQDADVKAWLGAVGGKINFGMFDVHGQVFYASGEDYKDNDTDVEAFFVLSQNDFSGQSYYWAEILGLGIFDDRASNNSPADKISNVIAANIGASVKPMDKLTVTLDVWYSQLAEDIYVENGTTYGPLDVIPATASAESSLGTEVDLRLTYQLVQNLNLDVVGAYLFAGDATTAKANDDANPYEVGAQLSLSF